MQTFWDKNIFSAPKIELLPYHTPPAPNHSQAWKKCFCTKITPPHHTIPYYRYGINNAQCCNEEAKHQKQSSRTGCAEVINRTGGKQAKVPLKLEVECAPQCLFLKPALVEKSVWCTFISGVCRCKNVLFLISIYQDMTCFWLYQK